MKTKSAPKGVSWGSTNTPENKRINLSDNYVTREGKRVINLHCVLHNSLGREVTFPIKGTVILKEKPYRTTYTIWTLEGRHGLFGKSKHDLVKVN